MEVAAVRGCVSGEPAAGEVHLGGGTPTRLSPQQLIGLMGTLVDAFPLGEGAELSVEADPRVTTEAHIAALRECGFQRLSLGVQDFDREVQRAIHREQSPDCVASLTECARGAGFRSVNFDLIYGLPFQTVASFDRTLDQVFALQPDRVALYSYAHVTWIAKQQRGFERKDLPDGRSKIEIMLHAIRRFLDAGYVHIGMDHFAKRDDALAVAVQTGELRRNFMGYTTQACENLIGFGPSAISESKGSYAQSLHDLSDWDDAVSNSRLASFRGHAPSEDDRRRAWVIGRIMCRGDVSGEEYRREFCRSLADDFAVELRGLAALASDGLVEFGLEGDFHVTPIGRVLLRNVAMVFDAYLPEQQRRGRPIFSKAL